MSAAQPIPLQIWHIPAVSDPDQLIQLTSLLSTDEQQRAQKTIKSNTRATYTTAHAAIRQILAQQLQILPQDIELVCEPHGKPALKQAACLHFNLSHTKDYALLAISDLSPVGVDIEICKQTRDILAIAKRFFSQAEHEWLASTAIEQRFDRFYQLWCHKEAYLKALGLGLQGGLSSFSLSPDDLISDCSISDDNKLVWSLRALNVPSPYRAAVAIAQADITPQVMQWQINDFL